MGQRLIANREKAAGRSCSGLISDHDLSSIVTLRPTFLVNILKKRSDMTRFKCSPCSPSRVRLAGRTVAVLEATEEV